MSFSGSCKNPNGHSLRLAPKKADFGQNAASPSTVEIAAGEDASCPGQFERLDQITSITNERLRPTRRIASASIIARLLTTKRLLPSEKIALRSVHHWRQHRGSYQRHHRLDREIVSNHSSIELWLHVGPNSSGEHSWRTSANGEHRWQKVLARSQKGIQSRFWYRRAALNRRVHHVRFRRLPRVTTVWLHPRDGLNIRLLSRSRPKADNRRDCAEAAGWTHEHCGFKIVSRRNAPRRNRPENSRFKIAPEWDYWAQP